jgi:hypothetical protein
MQGAIGGKARRLADKIEKQQQATSTTTDEKQTSKKTKKRKTIIDFVECIEEKEQE